MSKLRRMSRRIDRCGPAVVLAFSITLMAQASAAIDLTTPEKLAGQWDLSLSDTNRRCRLVLRADQTGPGLGLGVSAGCRRAMPLLSDVGTWTLKPGDRVAFDDDKGREILSFAAQGQGPLMAKGPEGETYVLAAADTSSQGQQFTVMPGAPAGGVDAPARTVVAATTAPVAAAAARADDMAGRYSVLREGGKDTGCMITLDAKARGPKGGNKAVLAPACRDQGIVIFDPVGWGMEKGRLSLTARKGHHALFDRKDDGTWQKDPKEGKALGLKKMAP